MSAFKLYAYDGPVYIFGEAVCDRWKGQTMAVSKPKAKSNLSSQFKQKYGYEQWVPLRFGKEIVTTSEVINNG